jgi:hypothetical protein
MGAEAADFFFYWRYSEVLADDWVWHIPGGINYQMQDFRLKMFQNCYVGIWGRAPEVGIVHSWTQFSLAPELNAICPDGFEYCFVDEEFIADREFGLAS